MDIYDRIVKNICRRNFIVIITLSLLSNNAELIE